MPSVLARAMTPKVLVKTNPRQAADLRKLSKLVAEPDMAELREICLDESLIVGTSQLMPVSVIGEGAFGIVWKCALHPVDKAPISRVETGGGIAVSLADSLGARSVLEAARAPFAASGWHGGSAAAPPAKLYTGPPRFVALKRIKLEGVDGAPGAHGGAELARSVAAFSAELISLKSLSHPNIIAYIGAVVYEADADDDAAADAAAAGSPNAREQLAILQEYAPFGTLGTAFRGRMAASRAFATGDGLRWAHHVALGLAYLHGCSPPIIHRDLKPENVLLCLPHATAKLADFGLSTFDLSAPAWAAAAGAPARRQPSRRKPTGMVGSMRYMAPENYRGEAYTYKSDVYSFAILLYELLARARAYDDLFLNGEQIAVDAASERLLRPTLPAAWPAEAHALLRACWHADPAQRPDFAAIAAELEAWRSDSTDRVLRAVWAGARVPIAERARALVQGRAAQVAPRWPTKPVPPGGELEPGTTTVISAKRDGGATHSRRSSMAAARAEHDAAQAGF